MSLTDQIVAALFDKDAMINSREPRLEFPTVEFDNEIDMAIEFHHGTLDVFRAFGDLKWSWQFNGSAHYGPSDQDGWGWTIHDASFAEVYLKYLGDADGVYIVFQYDPEAPDYSLKHVLTEDG